MTSPAFFLKRSPAKNVMKKDPDFFSLPVFHFDAEKEHRSDFFKFSNVLCKSDLGKDLALLYGPRNEMVPGKYKKASAFYFEDGEGGLFAAFCETGDRGSGWYWLPNANSPSFEATRKDGGNVLSLNDCPLNWIKALEQLAASFVSQLPDELHADEDMFDDKKIIEGLEKVKESRLASAPKKSPKP